MRRFARSFLAFACLFTLAQVAAIGQTLEAVSGGGQTTFLGTPFHAPLVARLTDGNGMPLVGVDVAFEVDGCYGFEGSTCPPSSAYPHFGGVSPVVATTDSSGIAVAQPLIAGDETGSYDVFAWIMTDGGIIHAFFPLQQAAPIATVPITPAFTGAWYDPAQAGHGIFIEVLPSQRLLAYWFTFTPDGAQAWFGGDGAITSDFAVVDAIAGTGGRWIPNFDPAQYAPQHWGALTFAFTDCNHGRVWFVSDPYDPAWGTGSMDITRLTQPAGIADDACH
jgi:hypothetical protein